MEKRNVKCLFCGVEIKSDNHLFCDIDCHDKYYINKDKK